MGPSHLPKRRRSLLLNFWPLLLWLNCWMHQDATCYGGRPRPRRHCVRWMDGWIKMALGDLAWRWALVRPHCASSQLLPPLKWHTSNFRPMPVVEKRLYGLRCHFGMEVSLGAGDFVFDGDPATPKRAHPPRPIFGPCLLWPNGCRWMDENATWYGS